MEQSIIDLNVYACFCFVLGTLLHILVRGLSNEGTVYKIEVHQTDNYSNMFVKCFIF